VPHTSTYALTNATLPYVLAVADRGVAGALAREPALVHGLTTVGGSVTNRAVGEALGRPVVDAATALTSN
jgi:alanine dehydrogenase